MIEKFKNQKFNPVSSQILACAVGILTQYSDDGYTMTLRQLYYQFIARDLFPDSWVIDLGGGQQTKNHQKNYKKLGDLINDGRMAGIIDWDHIEDRTRSLEEWSTHTSISSALRKCADSYSLDKWAKQRLIVEVWVEKEALAGVISDICAKWQVPYFACRGYVSASAAYGAYQRIKERYEDNEQRTLVLHLGDHDPSGIDMSRDNFERLRDMLASAGSDYEDIFQLDRLGLNMDQIKGKKLPPSPAKITDSRAAESITRFGENSWELDALSPDKLEDLISTGIQGALDLEQWDEDCQKNRADRLKIVSVANKFDREEADDDE